MPIWLWLVILLVIYKPSFAFTSLYSFPNKALSNFYTVTIHSTGCIGQYSVQYEHNAEGAYPVYGEDVESVDGCTELCQSIPECLAFDYDRNEPPYKNARCWIHDNPALVVKQQPAVDHYSRGKCQEPSMFTIYPYVKSCTLLFMLY